MSPIVITIVGGGVFAPRLCEALARAVQLPEIQLRLSARRMHRLRIVAEHAARRVEASRPGWSVRAATSLDAALEGATIVVLLVRIGGFDARAWDESFPRRFGLAGDEGLGPGGIANAWRSVPALTQIARSMARVSPGARVLNLMAPLGITTRLLLDERLDAVGLCELPLATIESWLAAVGGSTDESTWSYGGLNHLGWFWDVRSGGQEVLERLAAAPASSAGTTPVDRETLQRYGAAPLRYFYEVFDPERAQRLGLMRPRDRARALRSVSEAMLARFTDTPGAELSPAEGRATPWLDRAVVPIAAALLGGPAHNGFVDVQNGRRIPELPADLTVEVSATFTSNRVSPADPGPLPKPVTGFLVRVGRSESLAYEAARQQHPGLLAEAIRSLPLPISDAMVSELTALARKPIEP